MADRIQINVEVNDKQAKVSLKTIDSILQNLKSQTVDIKINVSGLENLNKQSVTALNSIARMTTAISKQTAAEAKLETAKSKVITATAQQTAADAKLKDANTRAIKAANELTDATNRTGDSLLSNAKKFATWMLLGNAISGVKRAFEEALDEMKKADSELVTVRKVTGMTADELERLNEVAFATATKYGESASEYLANVAEFARAGYGDTADKLAELSVKTQIVGDTTAETANQFLLAVDAAYKYNGSITSLSRVLDGANEIDNKYATSIEKIASGLGIVAPVAAQANIGIDELTAAIGTITAVTQRSGSEAATALRAIILNIVGDTKTEIEDGATWTAGQIKGLSDIIKIYAKDAYDAAQASGEVLNPMKAIAGLAQSVKDGVLSASQLYEMVSDIGGKLRASQLTALVQNWDMYESMLADYATAYGSAEKEIENATDSWERKTKQLQNTWTEFIQRSINTKSIKALLDMARTLLTVTGSLGNAISIISGLVIMFKSASIVSVFEKLGTSIKTAGDNLRSFGILIKSAVSKEENRLSLITKTNTYQRIYNQLLEQEAIRQGVTTDKVDANTRAQIANTAAKKTAAAAIVTWIGLAITAVSVISTAVSAIEAKAAQRRQQIIENSKATAEQVENLTELIQQYETLSKERKDGGTWDNTQISQAKSLQEQITALVGEQANQLDLVNGNYDDEIEKLKEILSLQAQTGIMDASDAERAALKNAKKAISRYGRAAPTYGLLEPALEATKDNQFVKVRRDKGNGAVYVDYGAQNQIETAEDAIKYFNEVKKLRAAWYEAGYTDTKQYQELADYRAKYKDVFEELENALKAKQRYQEILEAVRTGDWSKIFQSTDKNGGGSGGEGGITPTTDDVKKLYEELEKAINKQLDARKKELDAIKEAHEVVKETLNLEEKRLKVAEARKALESAEKERTIRVYNAATGQWEWQADESAIEKAKENLKSAKEDLDEAEWQSQYNAKLRAYEEEKKHYKDIFEKAEDIADKTRSIDDILDDIKKNQLPEFQNVFEALIKKLGGDSDASGAGTTGTVENKGYTAPEGASANWFDMVMSGIKQRDATRGSKSESSKGLSEEDVERFERFDWKDRGYTFQRPQNSAKSFGDTYNNSRETEFNRITERLSTTNNNLNRNDTRNYYVGGVSVAKEKLEAMSALDALDNLSLFVNSMTL